MDDAKCFVATCCKGTGEARIYHPATSGRERRALLHVRQFSTYGRAAAYVQEYNEDQRRHYARQSA